MAVNKSNGLLKIFSVVMLIIVIAVAVVATRNSDGTDAKKKSSDVVYDLSDEEADILGVTAGDTPHDTLKTLLGALKDTREEIKQANERNNRLEQENQRMREREAEVDNRITSEVESRVSNSVSGIFDTFNAQIEQLKEAAYGKQTEKAPEMPVGGSPMGMGTEMAEKPMTNVDKNGLIWIDPTDMVITDESGRPVAENHQGRTVANFATSFKSEAVNTETGADSTNALAGSANGGGGLNGQAETKRTPYYTIPNNSTLMGSTAMTALLGRVPINGAVNDPYPFKVLIGRENLIANGIDLPDVEGAIISGTSSGDWTLSCVRSNVSSITFVFSDGRISNGRAAAGSLNSLDGNGNGSIGWLSDESGVQCISGERKTNAPEYLSTSFALTGLGAAASSLSQSQTTATVNDGSVVGAVTGSSGKFILGQALSGGLAETESWYRQRYGQMFDAVYVPPGKQVAVHITADLEIDYDTGARKVKYNNKRRNGGLD